MCAFIGLCVFSDGEPVHGQPHEARGQFSAVHRCPGKYVSHIDSMCESIAQWSDFGQDFLRHDFLRFWLVGHGEPVHRDPRLGIRA